MGEESENPDNKKEEKSLKDIVEENTKILKKIEGSIGTKELKLKKLGKGQKRKGFVNYIYIKTNGDIQSLKVPIQEMTTLIDETPRIASPEYILNYKGSPTIIQGEWSSKPFSIVENFAETVKEKMLAAGYKLLALRAEQGNIKPKGKISGWVIFFIIIALIVIGYLLLK